MSEQHDSSQQKEIEAAAAVWISLCDRGLSQEEQRLFEAWMAADPRHRMMHAEMERLWSDLGQLEEIPIELPHHGRAKRGVIGRGLWHVLGGVAAAVLMLVAFWQPFAWQRETWSDPGASLDRKELRLSDGSIARLDASSGLRVDYSDRERRVELLRGSAHFDVFKDPLRPFVVVKGAVSVHAVGTAFEVCENEGKVAVRVTEGRVRVEASEVPSGARLEYDLKAGQCLVVERAAAPGGGRPGADPVRPSRIAFDDQALSEIARIFRLQGGPELVITDSALGRKRLSGSFQPGGVEAFVALLEDQYGVVARREGDRILLGLDVTKE